MINLSNLTPDQIASIAAVQKRRLVDLQQLPHWSNSQFEEVLFCLQTWDERHRQWAQDVEAIQALAFDVRMPDAYAQKLQQLLQHWTMTNQLT
ncbi:hypothetical protein [Spirosoma areae]